MVFTTKHRLKKLAVQDLAMNNQIAYFIQISRFNFRKLHGLWKPHKKSIQDSKP